MEGYSGRDHRDHVEGFCAGVAANSSILAVTTETHFFEGCWGKNQDFM